MKRCVYKFRLSTLESDTQYQKDIKRLLQLTSKVVSDRLYKIIHTLVVNGELGRVHAIVEKMIARRENLKATIPRKLLKLENAIFEVKVNYAKNKIIL